MANLIKTKTGWRVPYIENRESKSKNFSSIEEAAEFLMSQGVKDEAIDDALINMAAYNLEQASVLFDSKGNFSHIDFGAF